MSARSGEGLHRTTAPPGAAALVLVGSLLLLTIPSPTAETPRWRWAGLDPDRLPPEALILLPGIGPALAERLESARREGLRLDDPAALRSIRGIGPVRAERLRSWLGGKTPASERESPP